MRCEECPKMTVLSKFMSGFVTISVAQIVDIRRTHFVGKLVDSTNALRCLLSYFSIGPKLSRKTALQFINPPIRLTFMILKKRLPETETKSSSTRMMSIRLITHQLH